MARELTENVLEPGLPALVYTGIAHSTARFVEYRYGTAEPLLRMGNMVLREPWADRMFFIALHAPFWDAGTGQDLYPRAAHIFRRRDGRIVGRRGVFDRLSREGGLAARAGPQVPAPP